MATFAALNDFKREAWLPVDGWPYEVSDLGRVRRAFGTGPSGGRVLRPVDNRRGRGYLMLILCKDGQTKPFQVHRLVCRAFNGTSPSNQHVVNHKNGDTKDNRPQNLEWVTQSENHAHAYRVLGRKCPRRDGERNGSAKLCHAAVVLLRCLRSDGHTTKDLATLFGVWPTTVSDAISGATWNTPQGQAA